MSSSKEWRRNKIQYLQIIHFRPCLPAHKALVKVTWNHAVLLALMYRFRKGSGWGGAGCRRYSGLDGADWGFKLWANCLGDLLIVRSKPRILLSVKACDMD